MIFVFDLDGTVADASGRLHYLQSRPKNWKQFFGEIPYDPPFKPMLDWIRSIKGDNVVILQTGRPQQYRKATVRWLKDNGLLNHYDTLLMRDDGNYEAVVEIKLKFLEHIKERHPDDVIVWIDDTPDVVKAINRQGVLALSAEHFLPVNSGVSQ